MKNIRVFERPSYEHVAVEFTAEISRQLSFWSVRRCQFVFDNVSDVLWSVRELRI
jgi:hypothetical protein